MALSAVLFDLDDTLHDKSATLREMATRQYALAGLLESGVSVEEWSSRFVAFNNERIEKTEVFTRLAADFKLNVETRDELLSDFDANLGAFAKPYPGAMSLLQGCRAAGLKTGIVTNGRDAFQRSKIVGMGISELIDVVVTSGGFGCKKPDHRIFMACLSELDVAASEAVFVGDDFDADMKPAIELGMLAIWKSNDASNLVAFASDDLEEIHAFLQNAG